MDIKTRVGGAGRPRLGEAWCEMMRSRKRVEKLEFSIEGRLLASGGQN